MTQQEKPQRIREAALALFLARGIEGVGIEDIMKAADLPKGTFYRYFQDEDRLVMSLIAPLAAEVTIALNSMAEGLSPGAGKGRAAAFETLAMDLTRLFAEERGALQLYLQENRAPAVGARRPITEFANQIFALAIQAANGLCSPLLVDALVGTTERVLLAAVLAEPGPDAATLSADLLTVFEAVTGSEVYAEEMTA